MSGFVTCGPSSVVSVVTLLLSPSFVQGASSCLLGGVGVASVGFFKSPSLWPSFVQIVSFLLGGGFASFGCPFMHLVILGFFFCGPSLSTACHVPFLFTSNILISSLSPSSVDERTSLHFKSL